MFILSGDKHLIKGTTDLETLFPHIAEQWNYPKNGSLTPDSVLPKSNKKAWWICEEGHEWEASINSRTSNDLPCPFCYGRRVLPGYNDLESLFPDIAAQWHQTKNGDLKPTDVKSGSSKKVWWCCSKGHEWEATPYSRTGLNNNCPYCYGRFAIKGETDLATLNPELAAQWHPTKNGELTPQMVKPGSNKKVWWLCSEGHEWETSVFNRSRSSCPFCSRKRAYPGINDLKTLFPEIAAQWDYERNGSRSPETVGCTSKLKIWWKCDLGHSWVAQPGNRTSRGDRCPYCTQKKTESGVNDLATLKPDLVKEWDYEMNKSLSPCDVSLCSERKVWWKCDLGHNWKATISNRTRNGSGCPFCNGHRKFANNQNKGER